MPYVWAVYRPSWLWHLTLEAIVKLSPPAEKQVDPCAESGICSQEQSSQSTLRLCPHPTEELLVIRRDSKNE